MNQVQWAMVVCAAPLWLLTLAAARWMRKRWELFRDLLAYGIGICAWVGVSRAWRWIQLEGRQRAAAMWDEWSSSISEEWEQRVTEMSSEQGQWVAGLICFMIAARCLARSVGATGREPTRHGVGVGSFGIGEVSGMMRQVLRKLAEGPTQGDSCPSVRPTSAELAARRAEAAELLAMVKRAEEAVITTKEAVETQMAYTLPAVSYVTSTCQDLQLQVEAIPAVIAQLGVTDDVVEDAAAAVTATASQLPAATTRDDHDMADVLEQEWELAERLHEGGDSPSAELDLASYAGLGMAATAKKIREDLKKLQQAQRELQLTEEEQGLSKAELLRREDAERAARKQPPVEDDGPLSALEKSMTKRDLMAKLRAERAQLRRMAEEVDYIWCPTCQREVAAKGHMCLRAAWSSGMKTRGPNKVPGREALMVSQQGHGAMRLQRQFVPDTDKLEKMVDGLTLVQRELQQKLSTASSPPVAESQVSTENDFASSPLPTSNESQDTARKTDSQRALPTASAGAMTVANSTTLGVGVPPPPAGPPAAHANWANRRVRSVVSRPSLDGPKAVRAVFDVLARLVRWFFGVVEEAPGRLPV